MKKYNQTGILICAVLAVLLYISSKQEKEIQISNMKPINQIEVILKDEQDHLIPFTIQTMKQDELELLNERLQIMSSDHGVLQAVVPRGSEIYSFTCDVQCTVDFSSEIEDVDPRYRDQLEIVINTLLKDYPDALITVEGQDTSHIRVKENVYLNTMNLLDKDYHQGQLIQLYTTREIDSMTLSVPVTVYCDRENILDVIEDFYSAHYSVQFDNVSFKKIDLIEGEVLELHLSDECITDYSLDYKMIEPVLFSIKDNSKFQQVKVIVDDVVMGEFLLSDLRINEIVLLE